MKFPFSILFSNFQTKYKFGVHPQELYSIRCYTLIMKVSKYFLPATILSGAIFCISFFSAQAQSATDFSNDIDLIKNQQSTENISVKEYVSAWDEFGMSNLVNGEAPSSEIHKTIDQDITQTVENELKYDKEESKYLEDNHTTPEEMKNIESSDGSDVPDDAMFNPHPSLKENPEVNTFSTEVDSEKQTETLPVVNPSSTDQSATDVSTSTDNSGGKSSLDNTTNETEVYKAILQGENKYPTETKPTDSPQNNQSTPSASSNQETPSAPEPQSPQVEAPQTQQ